MTSDRDRLAEVLFRIDTDDWKGLSGMAYEALADALLAPGGVVAKLVREGQAEVLEAAAIEAHSEAYDDGLLPWQVLRDRAAALRAGGAA